MKLYIVKMENIKGFLTLEKAKKYDMGYFKAISFKTYCVLTGAFEKFGIPEYVLLEDSIVDGVCEVLTNQPINFSKNVNRSDGIATEPIISGRDVLREISVLELGKTFKDIETLKALKDVFQSFCDENAEAYYEYRNICKRDIKASDYDSIIVETADSSEEESLEKGTQIFDALNRRKALVSILYNQMLEGLGIDVVSEKHYQIRKYPKKN